VAISAHTPSLGSEDCPVIGRTVRNQGQKQKRRGWVFRNVEGLGGGGEMVLPGTTTETKSLRRRTEVICPLHSQVEYINFF
jgi:hypothetical protein